MDPDVASRADGTTGVRWPRGWFRVALRSELTGNRTLALRYFGRDLVVFRDARGATCVLDATRPVVGARIGDGRSVPARDFIRRWPVLVRDGVVFVWHEASGALPDFPIPALPELEAGWTPSPFRRRLRARLLDVKENIVDFAHFPILHRARVMGFVRPPRIVHRESSATSFALDVEADAQLFGMPIETAISYRLHGPGIEEARVLRPLPLLLRFLTTPIDDETLDFVVLAYAPPSRIPGLQRLKAGFFRRRVAREVAQDARIWEEKAFQPRPVLSEADGPIVALRTWLSRFYEPASSSSKSPANRAAELMADR
jgi:3-ketosteroid 9alpha-monooxygenase subunit A